MEANDPFPRKNAHTYKYVAYNFRGVHGPFEGHSSLRTPGPTVDNTRQKTLIQGGRRGLVNGEMTLILTLVIDAISQRHIETVVATTLCSNFIHITYRQVESRG